MIEDASTTETWDKGRRQAALARLALATALVACLLPRPAAPASPDRESGGQAAHAPRTHGGRSGARSGLDERVARLSRALALDAGQQAALRKVLEEQRLQVRRIWDDERASSATRIAATRAVGRQTADRIRGFLSEEQRKKYDPPPSGDPGHAVGNAHLEDWMREVKS
jgi:hypothetical protein